MDPFKYREIRGYFTARTPDTADSDLNPDQIPLNGYATLNPQFQGGSIVFTEIGEFAIPQQLQARIVDGHLMVETAEGEENILQPLHLPVTVDDRANQKWSWRIHFDSLTIGEYGDEVSHPDLSFPVEDGADPLNLSTVATTVKQSGAFITRGARGPGIENITASNGVVTVEWDGGDSVDIPIPTAALATDSNDGLMSRTDKAEHDYLMGVGVVGTEEIEPDEVQWRFDDSDDPILRIAYGRGIIGTPIEHEPDTVDAQALTSDVRDRVMSISEIPDWMGWDFAFQTQDGHVTFGRRSNGEWVGADGITGTTLTPTTYVAYGDSTTQGTGVDGVEAGWVDVLRDTYDVNITNKGLSGARAEEITALMGGLYPTAEVSGGTIPASGGVNLTGFDIDMVRAGSVAELNVDLITEGNQVVRGRIYKTGTETRQFSRTTPGDTIPAQGRVELSPIGARAFSQSRIFLGQGINNEQNIIDGEQSVDDLIAWYASAAAILPYPIVVWGMLDRGVGEAVGTPRGDIIAALEAWLPQRFGADFWPVRQYLASAQALTDAVLIDDGYEPTEDDLTAQAANTVPPSFRTGPYSVHLNEFGHQLQARYMYRQMLKRGWL